VRLSASGSPDARYAQSELMAFTAGWLRSLAAVMINEPTPQGLSGRWRPTAAWRALGVAAGLRVVPFRATSSHAADDVADMSHTETESPTRTLLSIAGELIHDDAPPTVRRAVRRLAGLSGTTILGLRFLGDEPSRSGWRLLDATPHPDLSVGGEKGLRALEAVLLR
jgi:hypothetical protein